MSIKHSAFTHLFLTLFILSTISACGTIYTPLPTLTQTGTSTSTPTVSQVPTQAATQTPYIITATSLPPTPIPPQGVFFLSLTDGGYFHLFAYNPESLPLFRLTSSQWDDITPALSPDGHWLAFSSHRNGYWDLYKLDLVGGEGNVRLTDTHEYDGEPSWSPDGAWIAYESYGNGNLDIFLRSITDPSQSPKQLTQNPAADTSPAWRPNLGRQIAFVSNRSGASEIWMANLDQAGSFFDISNSPGLIASHPAWSPDGNYLAWAAADPSTGLSSIYIWDAQNPTQSARWAGSGNWPLWQDNKTLVTRQTGPNQSLLTGFTTTGVLSLPPVLLTGLLNGLSYGITTADLPNRFLKTSLITPTALYMPESTSEATIVSGRDALMNLTGVTAPYPQMHPQAVNSFQALRAKVATETGWDAIGTLDNAYVPLTTPLDPGLGDDWLYTGRAFTINPALIQQNWMVIVREDIAYQTYWHIFLHTLAQDGSQGIPLTQFPWDFSARASNSTAYENGGAPMTSIPGGYWLDLTTLAAQYGWQRLPALTNWRTYYGGARFNELAFIQGLDWQTAMLELYPSDVLVTPTEVIPPTRTPTRFPLWYRTPTPTRTPTAHFTNTP